jgi:hypothetical protein
MPHQAKSHAERLEARTVLEALRMGVVSRRVIRHITYGRDKELDHLQTHLQSKPEGSCQLLIGGYGTGKSHLCESLAMRLETANYAVGRLELGASHGRPNNPRAVAYEAERAITVHIDGRRFSGIQDLAVLRRAIRLPRLYYKKEKDLVQLVHKELPGRKNLLARFDRLSLAVPALWGRLERPAVPDMALGSDVPTAMTAANYTVSFFNKFAHDLHSIGVPGLVLIFDEAERSEMALTSYAIERARTLMMGFALSSANLDTRLLHHYQNNSRVSYCPLAPSRIHTLYAFTWRWGLAYDIEHRASAATLELAAIGAQDRDGISRRVLNLYETAYGRKMALTKADLDTVAGNLGDEEIRSFVRGLVSALDTRRLADKTK